MKNLIKEKRNFFKNIIIFLSSILFFKKLKAYQNISEFEKNTGFRNYGIPSSFEKIFRWIVANPVTRGNGVSYSPLSKLKGTITPNGLHFERHHYGVIDINPKNYELEIETKNKSKKFSLSDLRQNKIITKRTFIECGGNSNLLYNKIPTQTKFDLIHGLFSCSEWSGVLLKSLFFENFKKNEIKKYKWVELTSYDKGSYNISLPISKIINESFLALYQNGEPIRPEQGYPVRFIMPGYEGSTSVKWLKKITLRQTPAFSRNETSRYTDLLPDGKSKQFSFDMMPKSIITKPSFGDKLEKGNIVIHGLAWSGVSLINRVQISLDGGKSWREAKLNEKNTKITNFTYSFNWEGKPILLQSRCIDNKKYFQPSRKKFLEKMGNNAYYHFNAISTYKINSNGKVEHVYS